MTRILVPVDRFGSFGLASRQSHVLSVDHIDRLEALLAVLFKQLLVVEMEEAGAVVGVFDIIGVADTVKE